MKLLLPTCWTLCVVAASAFPTTTARKRRAFVSTPSSVPALSMVRGGGGNQDEANPAGELVGQLARLDQQWAIQQSSKGPKSRWTKLVLPRQDTDDYQVQEESIGEAILAKQQAPEDFVYLLEPESSIPSCLIVFLGGAGLGQFPQVAYNEFLTRISNKLNAAVLTAPYQVGLDHFSIAKQAGERLRKAILYCEDDPSRQYPSSLPTYCLAHSLGAKLQTIYMGATGQQYEGVGFLSFNNFGFPQTIGMAREFAEELRKNSGTASAFGGNNQEVIDSIFNFAEMAVGTLGVEFTPSPVDLERIIGLKYDQQLQRKTRLFVFDDDNLDSSRNFLESCRGEPGPSVSGLPGSHLTPVYFKFGIDDLELPEEARGMAAEAMEGFQGASFGNEEELNALIDEVCDFILGKGPSREPSWTMGGRPRIAGGTTVENSP